MNIDSQETVFEINSEEEMLAFGAKIAPILEPGLTLLLRGELGAGKTTFVRGILAGLGWKESVRSPTYNLFSIYETEPPVLHADLFRVSTVEGTGIEDYLDTHACLVEWPDALDTLVGIHQAPTIEIEFTNLGRRVTVTYLKLGNIQL
jgi:tRNA threonylcarbamoyladenosine biosynthesis protein TsaE